MTNSIVSIEDVPLNNFHRLMTARSGGGLVMDGFILSIIGIALGPLSAELHLDHFWQGMIASSALLGIFFGGFFGGWLTDTIGRRKAFFLSPVILIVCSVAQLWVQNGEQLFILRFIIGLGVGIEYPVAGVLLVEFLPTRYRGACLASLNIFWFGGASLSYMAGSAIMSSGIAEGWRWVLFSPALLALIVLGLRIGTPESPRWLLSRGRGADAERVIKRVYGESFSLACLPEQPKTRKVSMGSLLHSSYGKRMLFVALFYACSITPIFAVYAFAPEVLQALQLKGDWAAYGSVALTVLFVVGCVLGMFLTNVMGRRRLLINSFFWAGIALLALGLVSHASAWAVIGLFGAYAVLIGGAQVLQNVYPNEIFPTEIRAAAVGMGTSFSRIGAAIGTWLVPIALAAWGVRDTMLAAAGITLLGYLVSLLMAPETRHLGLDEASALPQDTASDTHPDKVRVIQR